MTRVKIRDYSALVDRIKSSASGHALRTLGQIAAGGASYPMFKIVLGKDNPMKILISAGIHGDEPAGIEAVLEFLESQRYLKFSQQWEITLVPCLNPWGYEYGVRENHKSKDLNREFKSISPPQEIKLIQSVLDDPFDLALELHEDDGSSGFYLYGKGVCEKEEEWAEQLIGAVEPVMPVNTNVFVEGGKMHQGIVLEECGSRKKARWPMALYTRLHGTPLCLTLETSMKFPMEVRTEAHLRAIETALKIYK